ncbi:1162_t:CDS:2, partial [Ambispora leptoticha]
YHWLLKLKKTGIQNSEVLPDGTLRLNFEVELTCTVVTFTYQSYSRYEEDKFAENKAESMLFLGESYIYGRPIDCFCNSPEEMAPDRIAKYYQTHLRKCIWRPDRINDFKDQQIELISRIITQFNAYKDSLKSLTNREAITNYQITQIEKDIKNLVSAKSKSAQERQPAEAAAQANAQQEEERLKKEREEREKKATEEKKKQDQKVKQQAEEQAKQQELAQKRDQAITQITTALSQESPLTNHELSPQYQNWESQINQLTDLQKITHLQDRILADIQARHHDKKVAQELEKQETEKGFQDNQAQINNLKKEKATADPHKYRQEAKTKIEQKLQANGIKVEDLSPENQQELKRLKSGEITDPDQLVATETKIKQNIYQAEAKKKITDFTSRVQQALKLKNKSHIATLKKELLAFLSSSNIYYASQKQ